MMHAALEEEVMSLQKSKVTFADDVINAENAILKTMNTDQLFNLFCFFTNRSNGKLHCLLCMFNFFLDLLFYVAKSQFIRYN